jgi:asparagine synthase (glutamine-hydrolysing)
MCGFFQVVQKNREIDKDKFTRSLHAMDHRGPDAQGVHFSQIKVADQKVFCGFGHKRLSILDLDARSNQPFIDENNILLYNGEVYNYQQIRQEYEKNSWQFHTSSDTEVVAKALKHTKFDDIEKFNGMWALSFFDASSQQLLLSRDRYGKKPLFYYMDEEIWCVSSTIKAIKEYLGLTLEYEQKHLINYLLFGDMFPSDTENTHFQKIKQVLPGHNAIFDLKTWNIKQQRFFYPDKKPHEFDFSQDSLVDKLNQSVELRLNSDRKIALLLSGGIDSSLILSILHAQGHTNKVEVYMGDTGRSNDYKYAKACVEQIGIKAQTIVSDYNANSFDRFLDICTHHEKAFPFNGNAIAMSQMYEEVSQSGVPVVLDGSGGDEIFGGYWQRHIPFALKDAKRDKEDAWMASILEHNKEKQEVKNYTNYIHKESMIDRIFNPFLKLSTKTILHSPTLDPLQESELHFDEALCKDIDMGGRLGEWIWHNDRNSMMYSVESRSPFLDVNLHPFIFSGYKSKFHNQWNKYELRSVFDRFVPLPTQWRVEKQGFRWDGKHFFYNNKDEIIETIRKSEILKEYVRVDAFCFVASNFPKIFKSSFGRRLLAIAGIEYVMSQK